MSKNFIFVCVSLLGFIMSCSLSDEFPEAEFEDGFDDGQIDESVWQIGTWVEHGGQTGRDRCYVEDGFLNLVFVNDSEEGYLSSAIQTREEFLYGRWEARLKPSSVPGVLNSMYTIDWGDGDGTKQEIDIEFLTYTFYGDFGEVHFAVHADGFDSFNTNPDIELDFNPSEGFHVWGFEITPLNIRWFVDDEVLLTYTYSENDITIDSEYQLKFNFWSSEHWVNGPPEEEVECVYQIDWIRFYPYEGG
jgi:beta-glucanase (GH16 family)